MYFGWWIVGLAGLVSMLLVGTTIGAFGLFVLPVSHDLGLSRAGVNTGFILFQLGCALYSPFIGRALDRFSARRILAGAGVLFGVSYALLAVSKSTLFSGLVLLLLVPVAETGAGALTFGVILVRWFTANRGKAMLFFNLGGPISALVVVPIMAALINGAGWRPALFIAGMTVGVLVVGTAFFIRDRPGPGEREGGPPASENIPAEAISAQPAAPARLADILRLPYFWVIALACCLPMGVAIAVSISLYPFAIQLGFSPAEATGLMSATGVSAIAGILLVSTVIDRIDRRFLLIGLFIIDALAVALMPLVASYAIMLTAVILLGISSGVLMPTMYTYQADVFGAASFGTVRGMMSPLVAIAGGVMIRFAGEIYDRFGDYDVMFFTFAAAEIFSAALIASLFVWRPTPVVRRSALEA